MTKRYIGSLTRLINPSIHERIIACKETRLHNTRYTNEANDIQEKERTKSTDIHYSRKTSSGDFQLIQTSTTASTIKLPNSVSAEGRSRFLLLSFDATSMCHIWKHHCFVSLLSRFYFLQ